MKTHGTYTHNFQNIVENHPLFLMAKHNRMQLMAHPLCQSLATKKFHRFGCCMFYTCFLIYAVFLGFFTTFALRIEQPQYYYNKTNITFDSNFCKNVSLKIQKWRSNDFFDMKTDFDNYLKETLYGLLSFLLMKNLYTICGLFKIRGIKLFNNVLEIGTVFLCSLFIWDYDYQKEIKMRCPTQWQYGAFGLFLGYFSLLYYIQYIPIIGIYFIMLKIIMMQFLLFLPVLTCLIIGFGISFYMLFEYETIFDNFTARTLSEMGNV
jgi:hypothetical protein